MAGYGYILLNDIEADNNVIEVHDDDIENDDVLSS